MWRELITEDLLGALLEPERVAAKAATRAGVDPVEETRVAVTEFVRGLVGQTAANTLAEVGIPTSCVLHAVAIWRHRLMSRVPGIRATDERTAEYQAATAFFNRVFKADQFRVAQPLEAAAASDQPGPGGATIVSAGKLRAGDISGL